MSRGRRTFIFLGLSIALWNKLDHLAALRLGNSQSGDHSYTHLMMFGCGHGAVPEGRGYHDVLISGGSSGELGSLTYEKGQLLAESISNVGICLGVCISYLAA